MNLNDFFVQLYESEKRAKQRKQKLSEIQQEIKDIEAKTEETVEERVTLKGQLAIKLQKLSEEELNVKWMRNKEAAMKQQIGEIRKKIEDRAAELNKLRTKLDGEREEFVGGVTKFVAEFGLSSNGKKMRDVEASEQLEKLKKDEKGILEELQKLRAKQDEVDDIELEKTAIQEEIRVYRENVKELEKKITSEKKKTGAILEDKQQLAKKPENGQDFKRLQEELEACRRDSLEGLCQALQPEVERLQRQVWQKQIQRPMVAVPPSNQPKKDAWLQKRFGFVKATAVTKSAQTLSHPTSVSTTSSPAVLRAGRQWNRPVVSAPSDMPTGDLAESNTSKTGNSEGSLPQQQMKLETMEDDMEEIFFSDDEDFLAGATSEQSVASSASNSFPQRAKRVRFQ